MDAVKTSVTVSSSRVVMPFFPMPPLLWALYSLTGVLFKYPLRVRVKTHCSSSMRSSMSISSSTSWISVFRSSPYFSAMAVSSSFKMDFSSPSSERMRLK